MTEGAILNRWRLVLGEPAQGSIPLQDGISIEMDQALDFLYNIRSRAVQIPAR